MQGRPFVVDPFWYTWSTRWVNIRNQKAPYQRMVEGLM